MVAVRPEADDLGADHFRTRADAVTEHSPELDADLFCADDDAAFDRRIRFG
jgi:hypothetical protein